jgi:hypothetical protein
VVVVVAAAVRLVRLRLAVAGAQEVASIFYKLLQRLLIHTRLEVVAVVERLALAVELEVAERQDTS